MHSYQVCYLPIYASPLILSTNIHSDHAVCMYIIYTLNLGVVIAVVAREREQSRFEWSTEGSTSEQREASEKGATYCCHRLVDRCIAG